METVYLILLDTQLLIYFIPFVYLFVSLIVLERREPARGGHRRGRTLATGVCGIAVTTFAMVIATIPPSGMEHRQLFFVKVVGGASFFVALGGWLYWRATRPALAVA
jgi:hypothetical protein